MNITKKPEKILVLTEQFKNNDPIFDPLRKAGYIVEVNETFRLPNETELIEKLKNNVVATIAGGEPYTEQVLKQAQTLRIVARWGVGYDKVNVSAATDAGIPVAMAFGANHESVAEFAYAMALTLACRLVQRNEMIHQGKWFFDGFHSGLWGRTAGVIGLGRIGSAMARRCKAGNMKVLVCDPWAKDEQLAELNAERVDLETLLRHSDLVSIHAPSTPESRHTINADTLALMKPGVILINTSRGPLIDEKALTAALASGHLGGVGLDVFEVEPLPVDSPLRQYDNVLLSPHVSGMDYMAERLVTERCIINILNFLQGNKNELQHYVINPETLGL